MQSVFVIGDSISCYYGRHLEPMLKGVFAYDRKGGTHKLKDLDDGTDGVNGGDSSMVLVYLREMVKRWAGSGPDILLVNCGLHDIKRKAEGPHQVPLDRYTANLREICRLAQRAAGRMVWATTTPVVDLPPGAAAETATSRSNADVLAFNEAAGRVMAEHGVAAIDLYTFTKNLGPDIYMDGHVHFNEAAAARQAAFIAGFLCALTAQEA
ncbi:MAG TPA: SGNH/GDSL hydrolase family protein [Candidatus Brocadiia bacterium]|nr:SGNH/GDSL hydrolase family protein [Candidatus Brocadiia bacterium]